jgi:hypothetical protein
MQVRVCIPKRTLSFRFTTRKSEVAMRKHPYSLAFTKNCHSISESSWKRKLLPSPNFRNVEIKEVAVENRLNAAGNDGDGI